MSENNVRCGASDDEWAHFDVILGLTGDILPVVSNQRAVISSKSTLKALGKTPSLYNRSGQAVGIADWTTRIATSSEVDTWAAIPDYGICIQTRQVRALDIDVEDPKLTAEIAAFVRKTLKSMQITHVLPVRTRSNSGKALQAFIVKGDIGKRILPVAGGMIEFLGNGQQFIAAGTHLSGARYEWKDGLPDCFPVLTLEQFDILWNALVVEFAVGYGFQTTHVARNPRDAGRIDAGEDDWIMHALDVLSYGKEGQAFIECPFKAEHTSDSGDSSTAYFPAGGRGYGQGHFKCLHAHCAGRRDEDFIEALGLVEEGFELLEPPVDVSDAGDAPAAMTKTESREIRLPKMTRNRLGQIDASLPNLLSLLRRPDICGDMLAKDTFRDEMLYCQEGKALHADQLPGWRPMQSTDYIDMRERFEIFGFKPISRELIRDAAQMVAKENSFDAAMGWLNRLEWDGKPRVVDFLTRYFYAGDSDYVKSVSTYIWTALAGRVLQPGVKADMVPVLIGEQDLGKSYGISEMVPASDFYGTIDLTERDADLSRRMRGKLILEIGELRGLQSRDVESIKEFITRTHENWVPKYEELAVTFPRRCVFIGTHNQKLFLSDTTGNRRWLPVDVKKVDVAAIKRDREQLWAEAKLLFEAGGVAFKKVSELVKERHDDYRVTDSWADAIEEWLHTPDGLDEAPITGEFIKMDKLLKDCLGIDLNRRKRSDEMRVGLILRELGFDKKVVFEGKRTIRVWITPKMHD